MSLFLRKKIIIISSTCKQLFGKKLICLSFQFQFGSNMLFSYILSEVKHTFLLGCLHFFFVYNILKLCDKNLIQKTIQLCLEILQQRWTTLTKHLRHLQDQQNWRRPWHFWGWDQASNGPCKHYYRAQHGPLKLTWTTIKLFKIYE